MHLSICFNLFTVHCIKFSEQLERMLATVELELQDVRLIQQQHFRSVGTLTWKAHVC